MSKSKSVKIINIILNRIRKTKNRFCDSEKKFGSGGNTQERKKGEAELSKGSCQSMVQI